MPPTRNGSRCTKKITGYPASPFEKIKPRAKGQRLKAVFKKLFIALAGTFIAPAKSGKPNETTTTSHEKVAGWIKAHGGECQKQVDVDTTHLVCSIEEYKKNGAEVQKAKALGCKIVVLDWIVDSLLGLPEANYQKKLRPTENYLVKDAVARIKKALVQKKVLKNEFEKDVSVAMLLKGDRLHHIYFDPTDGFKYHVDLTRVTTSGPLVLEKYSLYLLASNALPSHFMFGVMYTKRATLPPKSSTSRNPNVTITTSTCFTTTTESPTPYSTPSPNLESTSDVSLTLKQKLNHNYQTQIMTENIPTSNTTAASQIPRPRYHTKTAQITAYMTPSTFPVAFGHFKSFFHDKTGGIAWDDRLEHISKTDEVYVVNGVQAVKGVFRYTPPKLGQAVGALPRGYVRPEWRQEAVKEFWREEIEEGEEVREGEGTETGTNQGSEEESGEESSEESREGDDDDGDDNEESGDEDDGDDSSELGDSEESGTLTSDSGTDVGS